ncbi:MAG: hypothetical protein UR92_C0034G0018 [Candidatus Nomurabacteria bacterium GW2011_GWA2_35_80]|uniref:Uncharacterized protein n=1 Tax=Candidatus Nomurabacteria bacterium GW2011_GWA2_35_80 TaxID=1618733 RepID=A0A0G0G724_9BACT|nr:MAG: hypothetical protein UR92_C0034G0018 [Candidatus Nomurabacteria bacterium GW2011_GWA2_35_80]
MNTNKQTNKNEIRKNIMLNEKDLAEYEKMMDNHVDADILLDFFFEKVPNFLQIVVEESENFRKESAEVLEQTN